MHRRLPHLLLAGLAFGVQPSPPVVNNPAPDFEHPSYQFGSKPTMVIDANVSGDSLYELYDLRDAVMTPSGSVLVVNNMGESIKEYDRNGRFLRVVSRKGTGPGEYRSIAALRSLRGDSLAFFDGNQKRITVLDPDRRPAATISGPRVA